MLPPDTTSLPASAIYFRNRQIGAPLPGDYTYSDSSVGNVEVGCDVEDRMRPPCGGEPGHCRDRWTSGRAHHGRERTLLLDGGVDDGRVGDVTLTTSGRRLRRRYDGAMCGG